MKNMNKLLILITLILCASIFFIKGVTEKMESKSLLTPLPSPTLISLPTETPAAAIFVVIMNSLLGSPSCSMPCWLGITPGVTTSSEAFQILQKSPLVQKGSIQSKEIKIGSGRTEWNWKGSVDPWVDKPSLNWREEIVREIILPFGPGIPVEEIINRFGPPEKVYATMIGIPEQPEWGITLYYARNGFEIQINDLFGISEVQLMPSDNITFVSLFEPMTVEERISSEGLSIEQANLQNWEGYGNIVDLYVK